jgi:hypothetical protein
VCELIEFYDRWANNSKDILQILCKVILAYDVNGSILYRIKFDARPTARRQIKSSSASQQTYLEQMKVTLLIQRNPARTK